MKAINDIIKHNTEVNVRTVCGTIVSDGRTEDRDDVPPLDDPGVECRDDDSESRDWSPPKPESSSRTTDCGGGGGSEGGRDTLAEPRPFFIAAEEGNLNMDHSFF